MRLQKWGALLLVTLASARIAAAQTTDLKLAADIDAFVNRVMSMNVTPGLAIAVVKGNEPVIVKGYGFADVEGQRPVTANTGFYIASATKAFTALTMKMLEQRGLLKVDDPISKYLPAVQLGAGLNPDSITIRQLLSHTHGIENSGPITWRTAFTGEQSNELIFDLIREHKRSEAGNNYRYTNIGYNLAGLIIDQVAKGGWKNVMQVEVLNRMRMISTRARVSLYDSSALAMPYTVTGDGKFVRVHYSKADENMHAAGGLIATANDLAKWLEVQMNAGMLDGKQIFPAAVIAETQRKHVDVPGGRGDMPQTGYGLGWSLNTFNGEEIVSHGGGFSEFRALVAFAPQHKIGVAVLTNNAKIGGGAPDFITQYVFDRALNKPGHEQKYADMFSKLDGMLQQRRSQIAQDAARRGARPQTLNHPLSSYAGVYENPLAGTFVWEERSGKLHVRAGALRATAEVYDHVTDKLRVELEPGSGEIIEFKIVDGKAAAMIYGGREFKRIR